MKKILQPEIKQKDQEFPGETAKICEKNLLYT